MAIILYLGFLTVTAFAVGVLTLGLSESTPGRPALAARAVPVIAAASAPVASTERERTAAPDPRSGHWGPRVAPAGRTEDAPAVGTAHLARQRALSEVGRKGPARIPGSLPAIITGAQDRPVEESAPLGYAPPRTVDRFQVY